MNNAGGKEKGVKGESGKGEKKWRKKGEGKKEEKGTDLGRLWEERWGLSKIHVLHAMFIKV